MDASQTQFHAQCTARWLALAGALLLAGCAHDISYPLMNSEQWGGGKIGGTLQVRTFADNAPRDERIMVPVGNQVWRTNGREGYPGGNISAGVTNMIASHLGHSGLFDKVIGPGGGGADYYLDGRITRYEASGQMQPKAEGAIALGSAAGLPGAAVGGIATKDVKTNVFSKVELSDLRLTDARTGRVVWSRGRIVSESAENAHFLQADSAVLYRRADWELKRAVNQMVQGMGSAGR